MHSNDLHNIKCSANKSANVQCSYYWVHEIAGAMVENPYAILPVENMNSPGVYVCIAKCHLGKHKECNIKAMDLEVIQDVLEPNLSGLNIGLCVNSNVNISSSFFLLNLMFLFASRINVCFCCGHIHLTYNINNNSNNNISGIEMEVGALGNLFYNN